MKYKIGVYLNPEKVPPVDWIFSDDPTAILLRETARKDLGIVLPDVVQWHPNTRTVVFEVERSETC